MEGEIKKDRGIWSREDVNHLVDGGEERQMTFLDWRIERQALPRGSAPIMAFGGRQIGAQYWTPEEVVEFTESLGWDVGKICVFEYTRE